MKVINRKRDLRMDNSGRPVEHDEAVRKTGTVDGKEHRVPFVTPDIRKSDFTAEAWAWIKGFFPTSTPESIIEVAAGNGIKLKLGAIAVAPVLLGGIGAMRKALQDRMQQAAMAKEWDLVTTIAEGLQDATDQDIKNLYDAVIA